MVDVLVEYAAPRYISLALDGYSLLLLDFVHASTVVLNSSDMGPSVSILMEQTTVYNLKSSQIYISFVLYKTIIVFLFDLRFSFKK